MLTFLFSWATSTSAVWLMPFRLLYISGYMPVLLAHDYVDVCPVLRSEPVVQQFHIAVELFQPRPHFVAIPVL